MNPELKKVKLNLRKIKQFCESKPTPSITDVNAFIMSEKLDEFKDFATHTINAVHIANYLCYQKKVNKSRP